MKALDVAAQDRIDAYTSHKPVQIHYHARLVTIGIGDNHSCLVRLHLEYWADSTIEFSIHHDDVFAVFNGIQYDLCTILNSAGYLDNRIDTDGLTQEKWILGDGRLSAADGMLKLPDSAHFTDAFISRLFISASRTVYMAIGDCDEFHTRNRRNDLQRDTTPHEPGP
jgi:hypothetical protein